MSAKVYNGVQSGVRSGVARGRLISHGRLLSLRRAAIAAIGAGLLGSSSTALAAPLTWDITPGDGATITPGSGTWDFVAGNTVWNNAGTNVAWTNANDAIFAGADGTYAINLAAGVTVVNGVTGTGGLRFLNSGYTLSAAGTQTIQVGNAVSPGFVSVAAGKSATIGSNVTVWSNITGQPLSVDGGGTLNVGGAGTTNARLTNNNQLILRGGLTLNVGENGTAAGTQFVVGGDTSGATLNVNGANASVSTQSTSTQTNFIVGNAAATVVVTLTNGTITNLSPGTNATTPNSGVRFGPTSAAATNGTFNLDGGTLTAARIYEGNTSAVSTFNFNGGTLKVTPGTFASSSNATTNYMSGLDNAFVKEGGAIIDTNAQNITIGQVLKHGGVAAIDGGLIKRGAGSLRLASAATYTGLTDVQAGTLVLGVANAIPSGNAVQVSGGTLDVANAATVGTVTVAGGGTISGVASLTGSAYDLRSGTVSATLAGTASATKTTGDAVTLAGTQTYTGPTAVNAGTLNVTGSLTSAITVASGAKLGGEGVTTGNVVLGAGSAIAFDPSTTGATDHFRSTGNIDTTGGATNKIFVSGTTGVPSGSTAVVMQGASITSNGISDFKLGSRGSLSLTATQLTFTAGSAANVKWKGANATNPSFWEINGAPQNFTLAGVDDVYFEADNVTFDDTAASFNVAIQGTEVRPGSVLVDNSANAYTISGVIAGSTGLTKTGSNRLTLVGSQTYTGGTTINGGTLRLGNGTSAGSVVGAITNNGTLEVDAGTANNTFASDVAGTGSFVKSGAGTTTITGANTYAGSTTISAGTLQVGNGGTVGNIGAGPVVNNGSLVLNRSDSQTFSNPISGSGSLVKQGAGILTLSGANSYDGATTLSDGLLVVTNNSALGSAVGGTTVVGTRAIGLSGGVTVAEPITGAGVGTTANNIGPFLVQQRGLVQSISGSNTLNGAVLINANGATRFGVQDGASITLNGPITVASGVTGVSIVFRGALDGDWITLGNSNNLWDGATTIFTVATNPLVGSGVRLAANNGLSPVTVLSAGGVSTGAGNTFDLNGFNQTLGGVVANGDMHITNRGPTLSTLTLDLLADQFNTRTDNVRVTTIEDGPSPNPLTGANQVALVKRGNFNQTLMGAHTYSGPTTIEAGTLTLANSTTNPVGSLNPLTKVSIASGARLVFNTGLPQTISGLSGAGTIAGANAVSTALTVNIASGDTNTFSGTLGGPGTNENNLGLVKAGRGTLVLANATSADQILTGIADGLDLQSGKVVFSYGTGTNPAAAIVPLLTTGYATNFATGKIRSTTLSTTETIGYLDDTANAQFAIARTLPGDATLDGTVNFDDLLKLAASYNTTGGWGQGDFNYDGQVNFDDLLKLAANYNTSLPGSFAGDWALAQAAVPEPTTLAVVAAVAVAPLGRRRRPR
jgi:autotransporter-associated beta strand protein